MKLLGKSTAMNDMKFKSSLPDIYKKIKPSIVAIVSKVSRNPEFPDIIGTGFIVHTDGVIATCDHVLKQLPNLRRDKRMKDDEWPARVIMLHLVEKGLMEVRLEIISVGGIKEMELNESYYGQKNLDIGFINVDLKNLKAVQIPDQFDLLEGMEIGMAGFPLGTRTLRAPGWLHQISPSLQSGVISAILPFQSDNPHGLLLDIHIEGGSSGSPVFELKEGNIIGMAYAGLRDTDILRIKGMDVPYSNPTSLSLAISYNFLRKSLDAFLKTKEFRSSINAKENFKKVVSERKVEIINPQKPRSGIKPAELD